MTAQTTAERQSKRRQKLNEIAQAAGYKTWGKFETETIKKGQITMKPVFKITNDRYSQEQVTGTLDQLQASFDEMGWDVALYHDRVRDILIDKICDLEVGTVI